MSSQKLQDEILVVDLETTCFENQTPERLTDIIEIGVAHIDIEKLSITNNWNVYVIPEWTVITEFCTRLNGVSQDTIDEKGVQINAAFNMLEAQKSRQRVWASWGNFDRKKMEDDSRALNLRYPMSPRHINVKTLFTVCYGLLREPGMDAAIEFLRDRISPHWKLVGRHHSGKDDACNIALILAHIIGRFRDPMTKSGII